MLSTPWRRIARLAKSNARSMSIGGRPMGRPFFLSSAAPCSRRLANFCGATLVSMVGWFDQHLL